jgi:hypothetical protein
MSTKIGHTFSFLANIYLADYEDRKGNDLNQLRNMIK